MGARTVVSSILTKRLLVGMLGVWVSVSPPVVRVVLHRVLVDALIMRLRMKGTIVPVRVVDARLLAPSTVLVPVRVSVQNFVHLHAGMHVVNCVRITVHGRVKLPVVLDARSSVRIDAPVVRISVKVAAMGKVHLLHVLDVVLVVDVLLHVSIRVIRIVSVKAVSLFVV